MKLISLTLSTGGGAWKVTLADDSNVYRQLCVWPRQGQETLADAAVRIEDLIRQLQEGGIKPSDLINL